MKKFMTMLIAIVMAVSVFAFSACGNGDKVKGSIDGKYEKVDPATDAETYATLQEKLDNAKPAAQDAEKAGGDAKTNAEIKLTVGGKSLTLSLDAALALILDLTKEEGLEMVSGAALNTELGLKADKGFGAALKGFGEKAIAADLVNGDEDQNAEENQYILGMMALIDDFKIDAELNGYISDSNIYFDAKVTGVPDAIKSEIAKNPMAGAMINFDELASGIKYTFSEEFIQGMVENVIGGMFGGNDYGYEDYNVSDSDYEESALQVAMYEEGDTEETSENMSLSQIMTILANFKTELSAEMTENSTKIKLATTDETKTMIQQMLPLMLGGDVPADILNSITISKLDVELYIALDANGVITAIAGNVDIAVSATVLETEISIAVNGALDCSLAIPEKISFPSFEGYVNPFTTINK